MPKLSIITINYNNLEGLQKTIQSVFEQSFTDYEYIIIDGGSADGSKNLIEHSASRLSYWVSEKDKGIYDAMNKGISYSKGEYLFTPKDKVKERKYVYIGNDVFIGMNVTVLDSVTIGDGAVIGAGSIVSKDIPPYAVAVGNPIKILRYRFTENQISKLLKIRWWDFDEEKLRAVEKDFFDIDGFIKKYENA